MTTNAEVGEGEQVRAAVALERRLVRLEEQLASGFTGLNDRLDTLNGQTSENTKWRIGHDKAHAVADGMLMATRALRKRDWGLIAGGIGLMGTVVGAASAVVNLMAG